MMQEIYTVYANFLNAVEACGLNIQEPVKRPKDQPVKTHQEKLVVYAEPDGKSVTAIYYKSNGEKVTAFAACHPEDEFDFATGAALAIQRAGLDLTSSAKKKESLVPPEEAEEGDLVAYALCEKVSHYVSRCFTVGEIYPVYKSATQNVYYYCMDQAADHGFEPVFFYAEGNTPAKIVKKMNQGSFCDWKLANI